ncbi:histidine phosphatase family protein [Paenibacillus hexagrammi]|uniref:Histidine phosphatase family protein n=1 Tax=Paenibacillus hexagrammi TaxID=2908839 RepID=A0ABY3SHQ1_9BACL|nr:histidine phosphatase family protein [Paenibacillus sp. YPD9-1]UJF33578.1 histidine phosphatase family protein [Paenibacillus sp. YPD9-1]
MKKLLLVHFFCMFLLIHTPSVEASERTPNSMPVDSSLLHALRKGGYILYVRHGETAAGEDLPNFDFNHCSTQKNLSEAGRRHAVQYGEELRRLQIPIHIPVQASPFCRTKETAALAFGGGNIQIDPFWVRIYQLSGPLPSSEQQSTLDHLTSVLEILPPPGTNKAIVAHGFPQGVGLGEITNLGTVIVKPRGPDNGFEVVGRFSLQDLAGTETAEN